MVTQIWYVQTYITVSQLDPIPGALSLLIMSLTIAARSPIPECGHCGTLVLGKLTAYPTGAVC